MSAESDLAKGCMRRSAAKVNISLNAAINHTYAGEEIGALRDVVTANERKPLDHPVSEYLDDKLDEDTAARLLCCDPVEFRARCREAQQLLANEEYPAEFKRGGEC